MIILFIFWLLGKYHVIIWQCVAPRARMIVWRFSARIARSGGLVTARAHVANHACLPSAGPARHWRRPMARMGRSWRSCRGCCTRGSWSASPRTSAARWSTSPSTRSSRRDTRCVTRPHAAAARARTHTLTVPVTHVLYIALVVRCAEHRARDALAAPARAQPGRQCCPPSVSPTSATIKDHYTFSGLHTLIIVNVIRSIDDSVREAVNCALTRHVRVDVAERTIVVGERV